MTAPMNPPGFPDPKIYPATKEGLRDALRALGRTRDGVAQALDSMGIRGRRGACCSCPVALYLCEVTGTYAAVTTLRAILRTQDSQVLARHPLPQTVADFVEMFDVGGYQMLEDAGVTSHG